MRFLKRLFRARPRPATPSLVPVQLRADELESRLTPATSTNWSGYAVTAATGAVTAVSGEWTVPTVSGSGTKYSAVWVGIDGYNSSSVEQTGIAADTVNGAAQYYAWYEMYPNASVEVNLAIHAGDTISASVTYSVSTGQYTLSLKDLSDPAGSNSFSINQSGSFQRSSAEWIVEAPSSNTGVLPLANFGSVTFTNASATINGTTGPINNSTWASSVTPINMVSGTTGATEATTEALNSTGTGFTVFFGVPSPPTSPPPAPPVSPPPAPPVSPPPPASPPPPVSPPAPSSTSTTTTLTAGKVTYYGSYALETLTITVKPTSGTTLPTGTIDLIYGGRVIGTATLKLVNGVETATFEIEYVANGNYNFTADYLGSSGFLSSSSSTTVRV